MDFIGYNVTFLCNGECLIARSSMRSKFKENLLIAPWACNRVHVPIIKTTPKHTHTESSLVHQIDELLQGLKVHTWNLPKHKHVHIDMAWLRHHRYDCIKKKPHICSSSKNCTSLRWTTAYAMTTGLNIFNSISVYEVRVKIS